jgi:hypothetical protein
MSEHNAGLALVRALIRGFQRSARRLHPHQDPTPHARDTPFKISQQCSAGSDPETPARKVRQAPVCFEVGVAQIAAQFGIVMSWDMRHGARTGMPMACTSPRYLDDESRLAGVASRAVVVVAPPGFEPAFWL